MSSNSYILKLGDVIARCRLSKSKIYRDMASGKFPRQVRLGGNCVGWLSNDIDEWISGLN